MNPPQRIIATVVAVRRVAMKRMVRSGFILVIYACLLISSFWMVMIGLHKFWLGSSCPLLVCTCKRSSFFY